MEGSKITAIPWTGYYMHNKKMGKMDFQHFMINLGDNTITGKGSDPVGQFTINGTKKGDEVNFMKKYTGKHVVAYQGKQDKEGKITGSWLIPKSPSAKGTFELKMKTQNWTGEYRQNGAPTNMALKMYVGPGGVYGTGSDKVGAFEIKG